MAATENKVALATTSQLAADAAAEIAGLGGNAVDCGIAAAMCSINTQPGVCALAGSAFVTIWETGREPITIDGNVLVPGMGLPEGTTPIVEAVELEYGGGIETLVGASSVAVPGTLAALHTASEKFGKLPWRELLRPTIRATRVGFPLAAACHYYLGYAGEIIYGRSNDGYCAVHQENGQLRDIGSTIVIPHLADTLTAIADEGQRIFYEGEIGRRIAEHVQERGGLLTLEDLKCYVPETRHSLKVQVGDWEIATNPPPAIGGASLAAMLLAFGTDPLEAWNEAAVLKLVQTQYAVMSYRQKKFDTAGDVAGPVAEALRLASSGALLSNWASGSTVHTSAVDGDGRACSITASSGYGSGEMPDNTGLWLNNCLGELELNRGGLTAGPPGKRLPSNMAPGTARNKDRVLAFGSPGADRITTALHQFLVNFSQLGLDLAAAVAHPRMHLILAEPASRLAVEPGFDLPEFDVAVTRYPNISMFFGGVVAALAGSDGQFEAAADPRREGGTYIGPEGAKSGESIE
jgi:gamma-glutamyltranspeptidase/glutathione hydrolase